MTQRDAYQQGKEAGEARTPLAYLQLPKDAMAAFMTGYADGLRRAY